MESLSTKGYKTPIAQNTSPTQRLLDLSYPIAIPDAIEGANSQFMNPAEALEVLSKETGVPANQIQEIASQKGINLQTLPRGQAGFSIIKMLIILGLISIGIPVACSVINDGAKPEQAANVRNAAAVPVIGAMNAIKVGTNFVIGGIDAGSEGGEGIGEKLWTLAGEKGAEMRAEQKANALAEKKAPIVYRPASTVSTEAPVKTVTVEKGKGVSHIARECGATIQQVIAANPGEIKNPNSQNPIITPGQVLKCK